MLKEMKENKGEEDAGADSNRPRRKPKQGKDTLSMEDVLFDENAVGMGEDEPAQEQEHEAEETAAGSARNEAAEVRDMDLGEGSEEESEATAATQGHKLEGEDDDTFGPGSDEEFGGFVETQAEELLNEEWEELCPVAEQEEAEGIRRAEGERESLQGHASGAGERAAEGSVDLSSILLKEFQAKEADAKYISMGEFRRKLPSYQMREEIVSVIESNQVVVISGETGCGKTTQVPQFILDDYLAKGRGAECKILCTQPRRISAISVAQRVAAERAEACGASVGYQVLV